MFRHLTIAVVVAACVALTAAEAFARNPAYYGTRRGVSARYYSGQYQVQRPNIVPTFSLPVYGGGTYGSYYRGRGYYGGGYYPQPVIIYPPAVYYGY